jgi:hypothetical protein
MQKAVKWNPPFHGMGEDQGRFQLSLLHEPCQSGFLTGHVTASCPPGSFKNQDTRYLDIHENDELNKAGSPNG